MGALSRDPLPPPELPSSPTWGGAHSQTATQRKQAFCTRIFASAETHAETLKKKVILLHKFQQTEVLHPEHSNKISILTLFYTNKDARLLDLLFKCLLILQEYSQPGD